MRRRDFLIGGFKGEDAQIETAVLVGMVLLLSESIRGAQRRRPSCALAISVGSAGLPQDHGRLEYLPS